MAAGRWYQMYASLIPNKTYEHSGMCVTADYSFLRSTPNALYGILYIPHNQLHSTVSSNIYVSILYSQFQRV